MIIISLSIDLLQAQPPPEPPGARLINPDMRLEDHPQEDEVRVELLLRSVRPPRRDFDLIRKHAAEALAISRKLSYRRGEARAYEALAISYEMAGKSDSVLYNFTKAYEIFQELDDSRGAVSSNFGVGRALFRLGQFSEALEIYLEVLDFHEKQENSLEIGRVYNQIGLLYMEEQELDLAISNFEKSLAAFKESDRRGAGVLTMNHLARAYVFKGNFDRALMLLDRGIDLGREYGAPVVQLHLTKGKLYLDSENYEAAEQELIYAIELSRSEGQIRDRLLATFFLAEINFRQGNFLQAKMHAREALRINASLKVKPKRGEVDFLSLMARAEKELGNYEEAFKYMSTSKQLSDSLNREENLKAITELQTKYETEKKEQEIQLLRSEKEAGWLAAGIVAMGITSVFAVAGIFFWQSAKRQESERELEQQSLQREMEQYGILIAEKDSFITDTINKLERFRGHLKSIDSHKELNNLIDSLRQNIDLVDDEEHLFQRIEQVNSGFFHKLDEQGDGLTKRDKRLASLLNMELSSKEIGNILGINSKSVVQAKYRLKKKLNLGSEEDLDQFLKSV